MDIESQRETDEAPLTRGDVAALVAIGTKIAGREGRSEFEATCPYCKSAITTEIDQLKQAKF